MINDSGPLRRSCFLARTLHIFLLAALGGAAAGVGCLVTDPVPYEPAENIPPIVISAEITVDDVGNSEPLTLKVVPAGRSFDLELTVRDFNLDDVLTARLITNPTETMPGYRNAISVPATGSRDRLVRFPAIDADLLATEAACSRVIVAVSDRGFKEGTDLYLPPEDEDGNPITTIALVQWLVWVSDGSSTSGPAVTSCGVRMR